jgi:hypothetical protein
MEPVYLDLHIHTSENPNCINKQYDVKKLLEKIQKISSGYNFLISLTDHNIINKTAYINLLKYTQNVLLGVELHIKNYITRPPYHCHILFNVKSIEKEIDNINLILDKLYPDKIITPQTKKIPMLEEIIRSFDKYDYILLPHGGQSHSTFDKSIDKDVIFDSTLERNIYYNQFDGFTARDNNGLQETIDYFKKLGIYGFVNLITCTDNYDPSKYPNAKSSEAIHFIPTWMMANPTFSGLRLSLSEVSRLVYSETKPNKWEEFIKKVVCKGDKIDIDVNLAPGLNVVIGGSSSGKTLFVDSLFRKITGNFEGSPYLDYGINKMTVDNPSGCEPHYLYQNYIMKVVDQNDSENQINDIEIIKNVFPGDHDVNMKIENGLTKLKSDLGELINYVSIIDEETKKLSHIPVFTRLLLDDSVKKNILSKLVPDSKIISLVEYDKINYEKHKENLQEIKLFTKNNEFIQDLSTQIDFILEQLSYAFKISSLESKIRSIINNEKQELDTYLSSENLEQQTKQSNIKKLFESIRNYTNAQNQFEKIISSIAVYSIQSETQKVSSMKHTLYIENKFTLCKEKFVEIVNKFLKKNSQIESFESICPQNFFESNFRKQNPKVKDYDDFKRKVYQEFEKLNCKNYRIITSEGRDFNTLSAGWKTSIILDLILGYEGDIAPLIIDQPEDNLATQYINHNLIDAIKKTKSKKQIILVSHNATIPMLGDAQNIILCENNGKIHIQSSELEGKINNRDVVDYIAEITDGGKRSIKKRVKKYNLKRFKEDSYENEI